MRPRHPSADAPPSDARSHAVMLASPTGAFPAAAVSRAAALAADGDREAVVLSVARIWGTALGLPHPGLYPSRRELAQHAEAVRAAAATLGDEGITVRMQVVSARNPARAIARSAVRAGCRSIVVVEPPTRRWERVLRASPSSEVSRRTRIAVEGVPAGS